MQFNYPQNYCGTSKPKLTLYSPHRQDAKYRCDAVWLKNFGIEIQVANKSLDSEKNTDTEYSLTSLKKNLLMKWTTLNLKYVVGIIKHQTIQQLEKNLGAYVKFFRYGI